MAVYQIAFNNTTYVATVQAKGDALPASSVKVGEFTHTDDSSTNDDHGYEGNHMFFHHVREALYKRSYANPANEAMFPDNITDMARVSIVQDTTYVAVAGISSTPATVSLANLATQQITNVFTPTTPSNMGVAYTTSNAAVATVSASGLITAGATDGTATITITTVDGAFTDTVVVTVA